MDLARAKSKALVNIFIMRVVKGGGGGGIEHV